MNPLAREWVEKAEGDFATASRELRVRRNPNHDAVCFHSQQCAEKYLKARLQQAGVPFGKTHHLTALLDLALPFEPLWETIRSSLQKLTTYSVNVRYPGESADREMAREAMGLCKAVRKMFRRSLALGHSTPPRRRLSHKAAGKGRR